MVCRIAIVGLFIAAGPLFPGVVRATEPARQIAVPYDEARWELRKGAEAELGGRIGRVRIVLLRSRKPEGETGMGDPAYAVGVVVANSSKVVYAFEPANRENDMFVEDLLELRDVTGDGTPEVIFSSGQDGVSDFVHKLHVLYASPREDTLWDVAPAQFERSWRQTFCWASAKGRAIALVAQPLFPAGVEDPHFCHGCPHFYQYLAFGWRADRGAFVLLKVLQSDRDFSDDENPLEEDWSYIERGLL
jgi:hypothetical protein